MGFPALLPVKDFNLKFWVSIPDRALWAFRHFWHRLNWEGHSLVSIPDRALWAFRPLAFQTVVVFSIQGSFASAQTKNTISASVCQYPTLTGRLKLLLDKGFSNCVCLFFHVWASNPYSS